LQQLVGHFRSKSKRIEKFFTAAFADPVSSPAAFDDQSEIARESTAITTTAIISG